MGYFTALLDPRIAIAEGPLNGGPEDLTAEEAMSVAGAVSKRRLEFATGRKYARSAMAAFGRTASLPRGKDRMPIWPDDLVGSITHTGSWAAAVVARRKDGFTAIGIDIEPASELSEDLSETICTPDERARLASIDGMTPGLAAHIVFCMKEAAYKCQFPVSGAMLDFSDMAIAVDVRAGTFSATFLRGAAPFRVDDRLLGRFSVAGGHIASAVLIASERAR